MPKVTLETIGSGVGTATLHNSNFQTIENAFENTLSRDGSSPNQMNALLDMNGYPIINQSNPITFEGLNWQGEWSSATSYVEGDAVYHNGFSYVAIVDNANQAPPNLTYWQTLAGGNDATAVDFTPAGTGAVVRTVQDKLRDVVSVKDFGAKGDGVTDDTAAIQAALAAANHVLVPQGTYRCDTMISLNFGKTLELLGGAVLVRKAASANTDPVIWIKSGAAVLRGAGQRASTIQSENKSPNGVVLIGHWSMAESHANVLYCQVSDLNIQGMQSYGQTTGDPDVALLIQNPQIGGLAVYFQVISNIRVASANYGIWLKGGANGNTISNIQGYHLGDDTVNGGALFYDNGSLDNSIVGAFFHYSPNSVGIKLEQLDNSANGGSIHKTYATSYSNIVCEQGGAGALGIYALDGTVSGSYFEIRHNVFGGNTLDVDFNERNTVFGVVGRNPTIRSVSSKPEYFDWYHTDHTTKANVIQKAIRLFNLEEATTYKLLAIDTVSASNQLVEIKCADRWGSGISTQHSEKALFAIYRSVSGTAVVQILDHKKMGLSSTSKGLVVPIVEDDTVYFEYRTGNNGTNTTTQSVSAEISVIGASGNVTFYETLTTGSGTSVIKGPDIPSYFNNAVLATTDNTHALGGPANRWSELFAGTGTINTSDYRDKQEIRELSEAERAVALKLKSVIKAFKFKNAVEQKENDARIHIGVIAQDVKAAFESEGLVAEHYGILCRDEWYELDGDIVYADKNGVIPDNAIYKDRFGIRYDELFSFILSST